MMVLSLSVNVLYNCHQLHFKEEKRQTVTMFSLINKKAFQSLILLRYFTDEDHPIHCYLCAPALLNSVRTWGARGAVAVWCRPALSRKAKVCAPTAVVTRLQCLFYVNLFTMFSFRNMEWPVNQAQVLKLRRGGVHCLNHQAKVK